ncbi:MAG: hypothetical protein HN350_19905 [Phycisphaerales bacterium]|nr:hypothetical protein [Phycisphaerales bacterium]
MRHTKQLIVVGVVVIVGFLFGQSVAEVRAKGHAQAGRALAKSAAWKPVKRTTKKIALVEKSVMRVEKDTWDLAFYRNNAYKCGLSGNYTFLVVEPRNAPGKKAPLWVFFHGGAMGYYDKDGKYHAITWQDQDTWNHESSLKVLRRINPNHPVVQGGRLIDNTVGRRLKEGYRVLVVSYGDHDLYSGCGTPYPNNPKGGQVNGLQASMSAVEYTVANYPTTHVFAHGTSAGSVGAYALGFAFAQEDINLTAVVMDSGMATPRQIKINKAFAGKKGFPRPRDFDVEAMIEKIGVMVDPKRPFYPEAAVKAGFKSVPMLIIAGKKDRFFGGNFPPIAEAKAAGLCNHYWLVDGLRKAIDQQNGSPHQILKLDKDGHVPTNRDANPANDAVDKFIRKHTTSRTNYPFAKIATPR